MRRPKPLAPPAGSGVRVVTERPIIFGAESVKAILAGRKTQTRRVVKPQPHGGVRWDSIVVAGHGGWVDGHGRLLRCPFGRPGDRLWVRETWGMSFLEHVPEGRPATPGGTWGVPAYPHWNPCVVYRADGEIPQAPDGIESARWSPPIHMPRWASRLTLEVTGVRVERLQEITPDDARAEGHPHVPGTERYPQEVHDDAARNWFMDLWDDLNRKRPGCAWADNPWVWVVTFRRLEEAR